MKMKLLARILAAAIMAAMTAFPVWAGVDYEADPSEEAAYLSAVGAYSHTSAYISSKYYTQLQNTHLTGNYATDLVAVALSQVGYHEGDNTADYNGLNENGSDNYCEYNRNYWGSDVHGRDYAWCAVFISWCAREAGIPTSVLNNAVYAKPSTESGCFNIPFTARNEASPVPGDLIFFTENGTHWDHVGIVYQVSDSTVTTIEGNADNAVRIKSYALTDSYIRGYGLVNDCRNDSSYSGSLSSTGLTINQLKAKYPQGKYWNHVGSSSNNADGYTNTPCPSHSSTGTCNAFVYNGTKIGWQCFGFALKLGYDAYGDNPRNWGRAYNLNNIKPGDIINYDGNNPGHTVFVTGVNGNTVYFAECNYGGRCLIRWDRSLLKSQFNNLYNVYVAPYALDGSTPDPVSDPIYEIDTRYPTPFDSYTRYGTTYEVYSSVGGSKTGGWIDEGDRCVINEVYTNGWLKVTYPVSNGTRTKYMPISEFFDSSYTITTKIPAQNSVSYRRSDGATSIGTLWTTDSCLIIGESTSYYCFITSWNGTSTGKMLGWTDKSAFHDHSYQQGYEAAHPHKYYMSCSSCGEYYYTGEEVGSYTLSYESSHPHKEYRQCTLCGATEYTGNTRTVSTCAECYPLTVIGNGITADKTSIAVGETVDFSLTYSGATSYDYTVMNDSWQPIFAHTIYTPNFSYMFTVAGTYYVSGQANNSAVREVKSQTIEITVLPNILCSIPSLSILSPSFTPLSFIPAGAFVAEATVENVSYDGRVYVVLVSYDSDGRLLETRYLYAGVPVGDTASFGASFSNKDGNTAKIKAFVWSSLADMAPLAECVSFPQS